MSWRASGPEGREAGQAGAQPSGKLFYPMGLPPGSDPRCPVPPGVHKKTIMRMLKGVGKKCLSLLDNKMHNLRYEAIEADEVWTFVRKKERNLN